MMSFLQSLVIYIYSFVSAVLLQTYKVSLYLYINYPTASSVLGTIVFIYLGYMLLRLLIRLLVSSILSFLRFLVVTSLVVAGAWCYLRGTQNFLKDVQFVIRLFLSSINDVKSDTNEFVHELNQDGYIHGNKPYEYGSEGDFNVYLNDLTRHLRLEDLHRLVELFGLNLVQFYRLTAENFYRVATSDFIRNHYNGLYQEFNAQYREL